MGQDVILKKFAAFLEHEQASLSSLNTKQAIERRNYLEAFKKDILGHGYCLGFAICHGAMDIVNDGEWWEAALVAIASWDENKAKLDEVIVLRNKQITWRKLLERAINYIISSFASSKDMSYQSFMVTGINQLNILAPAVSKKEPHFILCDQQDRIKTIASRKCIAGCFTEKQLYNLLDENCITDTICLISNESHSIRLGYRDQHWIIYDPNYDHRFTKTIHKKFQSKKDCVTEIQGILGNSIVLEVASFDSQKPISFPYYEDLIKQCPIEIIDQLGFYLISGKAPNYLNQLFDLAKQNQAISKVIATELLAQPKADWTWLHMLARCAPDQLSGLFDLAKQNQDINKAIATALLAQTKDDWTWLHVLARYAPDQLSGLFDLAKQNQDINKAIATALLAQTKDGWTGLHMLARFAPNQLSGLFDLAKQNQAINKAIATALLAQTKDGKTVLHILLGGSIKYDYMEELFQWVNRHPSLDIESAFCISLEKKNNKGKSGWDLIVKTSSFFDDYDYLRRARNLQEELRKKNSYIHKLFNKMGITIEGPKYGANDINCIDYFNELITTSEDKPALLKEIIKKQSLECLHLALQLIAVHDRDGCQTITNTLTMDIDGKKAWQVLCDLPDYDYSYVTKLSKLISENASQMGIGELIDFTHDITEFTQPSSKEQQTLFRQNTHGKTQLWQELLGELKTTILNLLKENSISLDTEQKEKCREIMRTKRSRWNPSMPTSVKEFEEIIMQKEYSCNRISI